MNDRPMTIPSRFVRKCFLCPNDLDIRADGVHQWVAGWVKNREGGGGHGISLPQREDKWAHRQCVEREVKGQTGQIGMFEREMAK